MKAFIANLVALGPLGLFLLAVLDSVGVPVVGAVDTLLVVLANQKPELAYVCAAVAVLGSLLGSMILFWIARKGGEKYLDKVAGGPRGMRFRRWFDRYGVVSVFVPAISVIPLPMKAFVASAGVLGTPPLTFATTVVVARVLRYTFLAWLAKEKGADTLIWIRAHFWEAGLGLLGLAIAAFLIARAQSAPRSELPPRPAGR